ncbi:MAG TPA: cupin domain-containing protein [Pedobacter sp.]|nr:cupin domain-containing protein [Pedobacter sp.]
MNKEEYSIDEAAKLLRQRGRLFIEVFKHGSLVVEFYKPEQIDNQQPHDRDEIYVIASGSGTFYKEGNYHEFKSGDFIFVAAGAEHRFENFTDDFATWVMFYGPIGGEKP